jgi:hypothetical protein
MLTYADDAARAHYCYICVLTLLLHMCPHIPAAYVSSYYCYIWVSKSRFGRCRASMLLNQPLCYELNIYATAVYTQEPLRALPGFAMQPLCY